MSAMQPCIVFCLCAEWCGACREYRDTFDRFFAQQADATSSCQGVWVDVETHDALMGDVDIENFPTLVIANTRGEVGFAGVVMPHFDTLKRLVEAAQAGDFAFQTQPQWAGILSLAPRP